MASSGPSCDVAVIIPTHNRAALLPTALDSVLAQTADCSIEVAVIDDGSTDKHCVCGETISEER